MTGKDIRTLEMIASNCDLPKVQRDMLADITKEEKKHKWHDLRENSEDKPSTNYQMVMVVLITPGLELPTYDIAIWHNLYGFRPWYSEQMGCGAEEWDNGEVIAWREVERFKVER